MGLFKQFGYRLQETLAPFQEFASGSRVLSSQERAVQRRIEIYQKVIKRLMRKNKGDINIVQEKITKLRITKLSLYLELLHTHNPIVCNQIETALQALNKVNEEIISGLALRNNWSSKQVPGDANGHQPLQNFSNAVNVSVAKRSPLITALKGCGLSREEIKILQVLKKLPKPQK